MNNLDKKYTDLLQDILENGVQKGDRTGTGTISVFGRQIRHKMSEGFPLLTTKKMPFKTIATELLWFLRGDTNIKFLVDNNCHIWDGDCYHNYLKNVDLQDIDSRKYEDGTLTAYNREEFINRIKTDDEFAKKWGELGPIYGKQWRDWTLKPKVDENTGEFFLGYQYVDQIQNLIKELKTNPDSRRLMVNAWNVGELDQMTLPPCHYSFQVYTRELSWEERKEIFQKHVDGILTEEWADKFGLPTRAISLMWNQRSVDTFLGLPFNIASYGLLLEIIAKVVNMVPDELICNLGDVHLYSNHVEQAKEQIGRELTLVERINYGAEKLGYKGLLDYGYSQNEDELITKLCDEYGVPKNTREPYALPKLKINTEFWPTESGSCGEGPINAIAVFNGFLDDNFCKSFIEEDLNLIDYKSHPTIKAPLSN